MAKKAARKQTRKRSGARKTTVRGTTARKRTRKTAKRATAKRATAKRATAKRTGRAATARKTASARPRVRRRPAVRSPDRQEPSTLSSATTAVRGVIAGAVAAVAGKIRRRDSQPDAIELLEQEHRRFEQLLKQGEETTERARLSRREVLDTITRDLNAHEVMEERVLYPALKSHPQTRDIVLEGFQEHHVADLIVRELHAVATDDEQWGAKFKVLKENIEHHIQEEEGEMFRLARGIFSRDELEELAARMLAIRPAGAEPSPANRRPPARTPSR